MGQTNTTKALLGAIDHFDLFDLFDLYDLIMVIQLFLKHGEQR